MKVIAPPFPWFGDSMSYAKSHVAAGVLRVDDDGTIWRTSVNGKQVTPRRAENIGGKGYLRVSLHVPGVGLRCVMAHRLVYEILVGPIPCGLQINHKDLDKKNNRPSNLEVVTGDENIQHSYDNGRTMPWSKATSWRGKPRVTASQMEAAKAMRSQGLFLREIAERLGVSISHAHRILGVS